MDYLENGCLCSCMRVANFDHRGFCNHLKSFAFCVCHSSLRRLRKLVQGVARGASGESPGHSGTDGASNKFPHR